MSEFLCAWIPAFRLQAAFGGLPREAAVVTERQGPLELVAGANPAARRAGVEAGMALTQALGRCAGLAHRLAAAAAEAELERHLRAAADLISPRVQAVGRDVVVLDFAGLAGLHGSAEAAAQRLTTRLGRVPARLRTGIAAQPASALLAARCGTPRLPGGGEAACLAPLPLAVLGELQELTGTVASPAAVREGLALLERWGIRTLGQLAELPGPALAARLGELGRCLRELARGEATGILNTPSAIETQLARAMQFDPAVGDLETLKAIVERELALLAGILERRDRVVEEIRLELEFERGLRAARYAHVFALPLREPRGLVAQLHLELERHPPGAPVQGFELRLGLAHPRRIQTRMFAAAAPDREKLPQLLGLLAARFDRPGERRVGSPREFDTHRPRVVEMEPFEEEAQGSGGAEARLLFSGALPWTVHWTGPLTRSACFDSRQGMPAGARGICKLPPRDPGATPLALRVFRPPLPVRVHPSEIVRRAGPWRSAGGWWREPDDAAQWECDEWDMQLHAAPARPAGLYRLLHDRRAACWYIVGRYD